MGLDENSDTDHMDCSVYLNKLSLKRRRIGIAIKQHKHTLIFRDVMVLSETHQTQALNDDKYNYDHYYLLSGSYRTGGSFYILESIGR